MVYYKRVGQTKYKIISPELLITWSETDTAFDYIEHDESHNSCVNVYLKKVNQLPFKIQNIIHSQKGLSIGVDNGNLEVRNYQSIFPANGNTYAQSICDGNTIHIYYLSTSNKIKSPNFNFWNFLHIENVLLKDHSFILHCSYLMYQGRAILFSAPSGTGKTTQAKLWKKIYDARIINGDKCLLRKFNGIWYACGYPFHGSSEECFNESYPVNSIIIVRQSKVDYVNNLSIFKQISCIYSEVTVNTWDEEKVNSILELITDLCHTTQVIQQNCSLSEKSCYVLHHYLYGES